MKKIYGLAIGLMVLLKGVTVFAGGEVPSQEEPKSGIFESGDVSKQQESSTISEKKYKYKELAVLRDAVNDKSKPDIIKLLSDEENESIEQKEFKRTRKANRDKMVATITLDANAREKACTQWWDRGAGFAAGCLVAFGTGGAIVLWRVGSLAAKVAGSK